MRVVAGLKHIIPLVVLFFCGCTAPHFGSWDESVFSPSYWANSETELQATECRQQINMALSQDNIEQAQKSLFESRRNDVPELLMGDLYTEVTNRLLQKAEQARETDSPEKAGRLFRLAHETYPIDTHLQSTIHMNLDEIDAGIDQCADRLMHNGLISYRAGELDNAIKIWQGIGRFHPNHPPSLVAVNTARQQLKRLEVISSESAL